MDLTYIVDLVFVNNWSRNNTSIDYSEKYDLDTTTRMYELYSNWNISNDYVRCLWF